MINRRHLLSVLLALSCCLNVLFYLSYAASRYQTALYQSRYNTTFKEEYNIIKHNNSGRIPLQRKLQSEHDLKHSSDLDDPERVINPHDYKYVINPQSTCKDQVDLIIVVCSSLQNYDQRQVIRKTWGSFRNVSNFFIKVIFVFGVSNDDNLQRQLQKESAKYKDILQEDFIDSYKNLSLKSVAFFRWISNFCSKAKYGLKVDDDMYINVPNLINTLKSVKLEKFIMGDKIIGAKPQTDPTSKWYTPMEAFPEKVYPEYVSGTAYTFTISAAMDLYKASKSTTLFWLEDIYITGLCARRARIRRIGYRGFTYMKRRPTGCVFRNVISGHHVTPKEMYIIHQELGDKSLKCD